MINQLHQINSCKKKEKKNPQKGIEILTTPGARKAVTLLYADKSVYKRR